MEIGRRASVLAAVLCSLSVLCAPSCPAQAGEHDASPGFIRHHNLSITLRPDDHSLTAVDRMTVVLPKAQGTLPFTLAKSLTISSLELIDGTGADARRTTVAFSVGEADRDSALQTITVNVSSVQIGEAQLVWRYGGSIHDPPREPRHLRFVTPSETSGHIGSEGVYLSSESGWYPDLDGSLASYALSAEVPDGWTTVSQGLGRTRRACDDKDAGGGCRMTQDWETGPTEALTLVANRFVAKTRLWKGADGRSVQLATYFLPDNAGLADEYLDATEKYLAAYISLLGEYPFEQFAVVENFFASGLGMPSFTLLGSGSIKRHYVQPYALGHEIVHSWIGNSVLNRAADGNWVEGLTTYLANYYWHELAGDRKQAREQRRLMTQGYSLHVEPDRDYPVVRFNRKSDERDNAVGYQKSAMVFHMLRQEIGEEPFWKGLKQLTRRFRGRYAGWADLEAIFAAQSGKDLRWFFAQWVERGGAPALSIAEANARPAEEADRSGSYHLRIALRQEGAVFRLSVPLEVTTETGAETIAIPVGNGGEEADIVVRSRPSSVSLDPAFTVLRRLGRAQMAPVLTLYVTDRRKSVIPAFGDQAAPLRELVARIAAAETGLPAESRTSILPHDAAALPPAGSVLLLATPDHRQQAQRMIASSCGERVTLHETGFAIDGNTYDGPRLAALLSCHRSDAPGSVVTLLYAVTPEAVAKTARLLFFYGWHSYIVFQEGAVAARELWPVPHSIKEVRLDGHR